MPSLNDFELRSFEFRVVKFRLGLPLHQNIRARTIFNTTNHMEE